QEHDMIDNAESSGTASEVEVSYVIFSSDHDPNTYEEAAKHEVRRKAMDQDMRLGN
ncbi:hypothetical protein A2U01_0008171, partial [Trifolium medium]|nr:hypothetical protein [Trifolium medium]